MARKSLVRALGSPPKSSDPSLDRWIRTVHEILVTGEGFKGGEGAPGRYLKLQDLSEYGAKKLARFGSGYAGGFVDTGLPSVTTGMPEYTKPDPVTDLSTAGGTNTIFLEWRHNPSYLYFGYFEVWRSETDNVGSAILLAQAENRMFADPVGPGSPIYFYWVRTRSTRDHVSSFNATAGTPGQTSLDPEYAVSLLANRISETELNAELNTVLTGIPANSLAIQNEVQQREAETGELYASWTLKTSFESADGRQYVSGFGQSISIINGVPSSNFIVRADNFAVGIPGANDFALTIGTVDGAPTVGIGSAHILDLAVTNAAVQNLAAEKLFTTAANMVEALIGTGEVTNQYIGNFIESNIYEPGVSGWHINKNGSAEFRNIVARGDIEATSIRADKVTVFRDLILNGRSLNFPIFIANRVPDNVSYEVGGLNQRPWIDAQVFTYTTESGSDAKLVKINITFDHHKVSGSNHLIPGDIWCEAKLIRRQSGYSDVDLQGTLQTKEYGLNPNIDAHYAWSSVFDTPQPPQGSNDVSYVIQFRMWGENLTNYNGNIQENIFRDRIMDLIEYEPG